VFLKFPFTSRAGHDRNRHFLVITRQPL